MNEQQFNMNSNYEQRINIKQEMNEQQLNGEGEPKKKKKKKPFDPYRPKVKKVFWHTISLRLKYKQKWDRKSKNRIPQPPRIV